MKFHFFSFSGINLRLQLRFWGLLLLLGFCMALPAQQSSERLDAYFARAQQDWDIPGMAIGIIKDGKVVLSKGYGSLRAGGSRPVDGNSLFAIASNTKAFIAAAIGILVEEGKLSWDDPVRKYLPYFQLYDEYASAHCSVRDLLCHRVGLGTFSGDVLWYKSTYTAEEVVKRARYVPQAFEFRAGYGYSNLMFIAAGEVIQAVSGQPWHAFIQDRILDPLGMQRTQTSVVPLSGMENVAQPHKPTDGRNVPIPYTNWDNMGAAGGIISSTNDMLKWIQLQLQQGQWAGRQLFQPETQTEWWTPHNNHKVSESSRQRYPGHHFNGYGLGWALMDYGGRLVANHGGGYDGMYSKVAIVPEEQLGIVILTNSMKGISNPLMYYILDHYLGHTPKDWSQIGLKWQAEKEERKKERLQNRLNYHKMGTQPDLPLQEFAGTYRCQMYGDIEVRYEQEQLSLHFPEAPALDARLSHWHFNTFQINWRQPHAWFGFGTLQFVLDNNGRPHSLRFDVPNDDIFFEEIQAIKTVP
ncbi:MAG: serine hydrolase [Bacteroidetes bacterium]|nr:MAG: serine hydrolase [Bacteroidota bacterium]